MLPRWHFIIGIIFSLIVYILFPEINLFYLGLIFLSSFLIDFDHYLIGAIMTKSLSFKKIFEFYRILGKKQDEEIRRGIKKKSVIQVFHTLEFHIFVLLLGFLWEGFFYVLAGMIFHSLTDIFDGIRKGWLHCREFFLIRWVLKNF